MMCLVISVAGCDDSRSSERVKAQLTQKMLGAQLGEERKVDEGVFMTMYRSQAIAPLRDGWQLARSTKGGFSIELPLAFNEFRIRAYAEDGVAIFNDSIGAKSPGLLSWMATCMTRADGKLDPKATTLVESIQPMGSPVRAWQRTIPGNGRMCIVIVEAQGTDPLPGDADIQRFLHSFKRTAAF